MRFFVYIKILITILFVSTLAHSASESKPWEKSFFITPFGGYGKINLYGQEDIPTYTGMIYGADAEYKVGKTFAVGVFLNYYLGDFDNTNNTAEQKEKIEFKTYNGGLKLYYGNAFIKGGLGKQKSLDIAIGTVNKNIDLSGDSYLAEIGYGVSLTRSIILNISSNIMWSKIEPSFGGVSERTRFVNYNIIMGLQILFPSKSTGSPSQEAGSFRQ